MKDKNRIKPFLKQFEELWEQYPNLSFGQLVYDLSKKNDIYNIKDDEYLDTINEVLNKKYCNVERFIKYIIYSLIFIFICDIMKAFFCKA